MAVQVHLARTATFFAALCLGRTVLRPSRALAALRGHGWVLAGAATPGPVAHKPEYCAAEARATVAIHLRAVHCTLLHPLAS